MQMVKWILGQAGPIQTIFRAVQRSLRLIIIHASGSPQQLGQKVKMRKCTKNTAKFSKLLELIYNLKIRLMETNHYPDISSINDKARKLYDIYFKDISNDHMIVVNDEGWKTSRAHGYLKHFYKQHQKGKK